MSSSPASWGRTERQSSVGRGFRREGCCVQQSRGFLGQLLLELRRKQSLNKRVFYGGFQQSQYLQAELLPPWGFAPTCPCTGRDQKDPPRSWP